MNCNDFLFPLFLTLKVAGLATLGALAMGVLAAYLLTRFTFPGRDCWTPL